MAINYTGVDLDRYNAGNKFYSQDRYLQGTGLDKPAITFNPSNYDTGITSQYGNNSMYGTPNQGGDSMGATMPIGNFNQKDNLFFERPDYEYDAAFPNAGRFNNLAGKARDYGIKGLASKMLSEGGAQAGFGIAGFPGALIGMLGGAKLGFGARGPTDAERVTGNFYGNQGNSPMQYLDADGNLVDSMMQGYNISSAFGKGIPAAIDKRIATIRNRKAAQTEASLKMIADLEKEAAALAASQQQQANNMQDSNRAMGTGGYQSTYSQDTDFMEGDPNAGGKGTTATMGST
jgi:hypothetical protein